MTPTVDPPDGWEVWNAEAEGRLILAYRPDVFDGSAFPAACLPTIAVAPGGSPDDRPDDRRRSDRWYVALYLEPDVRVRAVEESFDDRAGAVAAALDVARAFTVGEVDYRGAYHTPRTAYLDRLDALTDDGDLARGGPRSNG